MSSILNNINLGPLCLVGGGLALLSYFSVEEYLITKYNREELYIALNELHHSNAENREKAALFIFDYISNRETVKKTKDPAEEKKDILYENGTLKKCLNLLTNFDDNTEKTVQCALIIIREIISGPVAIERRRHFNLSLKGLPVLFESSLGDNEKVVMPSLRALKSSTTFEAAKRELEDDIPRGSEGGSLLLKYIDEESLSKFVSKLESENTEILRGVTSTLSHISHTPKGAKMLSEIPDAVPLLLSLLISHVENICKNAVISISNIAKVDFESHEESLLTALKPILRSLNIQTKVPQKIAILEFVASLTHYLSKKDISERDKIASYLLEMKEPCEYLFRLSEAETPQLAAPAKIFADAFTQITFTNLASTFESIKKEVHLRIEKEQEEKVKKMIQHMRQMGIDIPPHVLSTMSPTEIQQIYFQMMQQIGMM
ncbi:predicted protein [Naegleria gruberi]|uniref:Predicted protein n=1 Tax=Naegleria gruberi TaxID=5762 RepID=D2VN45_NAEGR|nr:uncharacterized protein NAEGRDRAFT_80613 [Naegleria gruberi]EFC41678.1 predicted protein [Naegleria gruberi]|eukprot:XP_002674422.1 predicted protein [Naegleria gruberi strain NEG-M]